MSTNKILPLGSSPRLKKTNLGSAALEKLWQKRYRASFVLLGLFALSSIQLNEPFWVQQTNSLYAQESPATQQQVGVYSVAAGDTLFSIAEKFAIPVDTLVQLNGITDPNLIRIGDVLLIPSVEAVNAITTYNGAASPDPSPDNSETASAGTTSTVQQLDASTSQAISNQLTSIETIAVQALPGESVDMIASRYAQDAELLSLLNSLSRSRRLFPGQMIRMPKATTSLNGILGQKGVEPLRFGAVNQVTLPDTLIQGRTGRLWVQASRAISLTGTWNGLPIVFSRPELTPVERVAPIVSASSESGSGESASGESTSGGAVPIVEVETPFAQTQGNLWFALLPVPALIEPRVYPLQVSYRASNNILLSRTWQVEVFAGEYDSQEIVLDGAKGNLLAPSNVQTELELVTSVWSAQETPLLWQGTFIRPIGEEYPTTSPFGIRRSYNGGPYSSYHAGQDYGAAAGVPIVAPAAGVVALVKPLSVRGNAVILDHGRGIFTGYWHLSEFSVEEGQAVRAGDLIGLVGTTGLSTGAHLHWELRVYGIAVDPVQFINEQLLELP